MLKRKSVLSRLLMFSVLGIGLAGCRANETDDVTNDATGNVVEPVADEEAEAIEEDEQGEIESEASAETDEVTDETTQMIRDADYISKIKLITKGQNNTEIKVLDNIKEVISATDLPALDLQENRVYLVFLKNDGDEVVLVDTKDGVILLEGDNHDLFEKINKEVYR